MLRSAAPYWGEHDVTCEILAIGDSEGEFADSLRAVGYRVHYLTRRRSPRYLADFRRFVKNGRYSVVHQHAERASYWLAISALSTGASVVRTVHSNFSFEGNLCWRRSLQRRHLQALGVRFVAIAPGVQRNEKRRFGTTSALIWNWIDDKYFRMVKAEERRSARSNWGLSDQDLVLITVGNCATVKNHGALIEAIALTKDLNNTRYIHVGLEDCARSEHQAAKHLGISDRMIFLGWMENPREALAAADLYVMPSLHEGFSISALEALSVGVPSLLARVNGLIDLEPLFPGLIYTNPEPHALADSIRAFSMLERHQRTSIALEYPRLVRENFSAGRGVKEYCDLYRRTIERR